MAAVMIGVEPHKASHTAAAIGRAGEPLGDIQVRAAASAGRAAAGVGSGVAGPGLGGRGCQRAGAPAGPAARHRRRASPGRPAESGRPGAAARVREHEQERSQRRPVGGSRRAALAGPAPGNCGGSHGGAEGVVQAVPGPGPDPHSGRLPAHAVLRPAVSRRLQPGDHRRSSRQHAETNQAVSSAARARRELAAEFPGLRRLDTQIRDTRNKLAAAVQASGTTLTEIFGIGPVIAAAILGTVGDPSRFGDRDRFASCNGTAPIEVSSGGRKIHRLSLRGNRRLNHAIHMAAVTQIRHAHSPGRAYFDRKIAEGKTGKEALRALKRQLSDAIYARLQADAARCGRGAPVEAEGPGGQSGNGSVSSAGRLAPRAPALRTSHSRTTTQPTASRHSTPGSASNRVQDLAQKPLTTKRSSFGAAARASFVASAAVHIKSFWAWANRRRRFGATAHAQKRVPASASLTHLPIFMPR